MVVPDSLIELIRKFEDHPDLPRFVIDPKDWDPANGSCWFEEPFIYLDLDQSTSGSSAEFLDLTLQLDAELVAFVHSDCRWVIRNAGARDARDADACDALTNRGYEVFGHFVAENGEWLSIAIRTKHGPYIFD
jgi:hypothetical protein